MRAEDDVADLRRRYEAKTAGLAGQRIHGITYERMRKIGFPDTDFLR